jgi:hypothetical protein
MKDYDLLHDLYYKEQNYDGVTNLYKKAKLINPNIKKTFIKEWLDKQNPQQQTSVKVGKKKFLPIYSEIPYSFQIDLTFFPRYTTRNKNYNVLFTAINVNSRFAYAYKGKDKTMDTITGFLKQMAEHTPINVITCDEGTEFKNKSFKSFCDSENITIYFVKSDSHKLGIINRFHRTIKEKLTKHFIATNSVNWIDAIDKIVYNYNHTVNRGIGIEPYKVNKMIENYIINKKRKETNDVKESVGDIFEIGDLVRIKRNKDLFDDKMLPKFSNSVYEVSNIMNNSIEVVDENNNSLKVKKSNVIKVKQSGEVLPSTSVIEKANKEHSVDTKLKRELKNLEMTPINVLGKRISKPRKMFNL